MRYVVSWHAVDTEELQGLSSYDVQKSEVIDCTLHLYNNPLLEIAWIYVYILDKLSPPLSHELLGLSAYNDLFIPVQTNTCVPAKHLKILINFDRDIRQKGAERNGDKAIRYYRISRHGKKFKESKDLMSTINWNQLWT